MTLSQYLTQKELVNSENNVFEAIKWAIHKKVGWSQSTTPKNVPTGNSTTVLLDKMPESVLYNGDPGDSRSGCLHVGFPDYWFAPGARQHPHAEILETSILLKSAD